MHKMHNSSDLCRLARCSAGDDILPDVCTGIPALDSIKSRCNQGAAAEVSKAAIIYHLLLEDRYQMVSSRLAETSKFCKFYDHIETVDTIYLIPYTMCIPIPS